MQALRFLFRWWTVLATLAAAGALAAAHAFQHFGGYRPCHLCLLQRELYWAALAIAGGSAAWALFSRSKGTPRLAAYLLFGVFAGEAMLAFFHAGVEQKWWPGPQVCTGGGSVSAGALKALMAGAKVRAPDCDAIVWSWLGLTMAGWNAILAALLSAASLIACMRRKDGGLHGLG